MRWAARRVVAFVWGWALLAAASPALRAAEAPRPAADGSTVIRFAHAQLEPGLREAFDALVRDYRAVRPHVRVEQIAVPRRVWASWLRTQLVGGTAPDLIQLVDNDPNIILQNFRPLDAWMAEPNPHNEGTPLAGVRWQDTFVRPLAAPPAYWPVYLGYYAAPMTIFTMRLYYNRALLRTTTGRETLPDSFDEFLAVCEQVRSWSKGRSQPVYAVASARPTPSTDVLFQNLMAATSQRFVTDQDPAYSLGGGTIDSGRYMIHDALFTGALTLRDPAIQASLRLVRDVGQNFQPGFLAADRDDAMFYFLQQRAVMMVTGSWDYPSLSSQAKFDTGVHAIPLPGPEHPVYGRFVRGETSEADMSFRGAFALTKRSSQSEAAIDFLRYLTSVKAHARFSQLSGWVPAVRGVEPSANVVAFYPRLTGYPRGFGWTVGVETQRLWQNHAYLLFASDDGVERLTAKLEPLLHQALIGDELKETRESLGNLSNYDTRAVADWALRQAGAEPLFRPERRSELHEAQTALEQDYFRSRYLLAKHTKP
ncbi:MAG TPA: extracellular solute-binding protein [Opitutaceae bacterium]|nr:extracellular solute-binding protein [Opitutaceae bacterium]